MLSLKSVVVGILLLVQGYRDLREKEIPVWVTILGGILGLILSVFEERTMLDMVYAFLPGIFCLFFAKISREAIGYGDGILLCGLGCMYSIEKLLSICMIASVLGGITALVLFIFFHKKGNYEIPFVPFLFLGWLVDTMMVGGV